MAVIEIAFSGLMMFGAPKDGTVMVSAVTGNQNEVHAAWIVRGKEKLPFKGEIRLVGASGSIDTTAFEPYVPSVTAALEGAGLQHLRPDPCVQSPGEKGCRYQKGYLKLIGGELTAMLGDDKRVFSFKRRGAGKYRSQMSHDVVWRGGAEAILVGGKKWVLQEGDRIEITNHPQTNSGRHFGVLRHLWDASDNDTDENWPLPISDFKLRQSVEGILERKSGGKALSDSELLSALIEEIMIPSRPFFCPPARQ